MATQAHNEDPDIYDVVIVGWGMVSAVGRWSVLWDLGTWPRLHGMLFDALQSLLSSWHAFHPCCASALCAVSVVIRRLQPLHRSLMVAILDQQVWGNLNRNEPI